LDEKEDHRYAPCRVKEFHYKYDSLAREALVDENVVWLFVSRKYANFLDLVHFTTEPLHSEIYLDFK
jgi:hypothetical protein